MYNPDDLKHLEIMEQIETSEIPVIDFSELIDKSASNSLDNKIVKLCVQLKSQGFEKYASNIEAKFMMFKNAGATHLYRAHDETGNDLIEFAHPEGDVKMDEEASQGLSDVETILSQHKKIVDILQKEPTGKLAAKQIVNLIKNGQENIPLHTIAKKFQYFADYLDKQFLSRMPFGEKDDHSQQFYTIVGQWHEVANVITQELMSNDELPEAQAIQLVKNRLQNNSISSKHAASVNTVADVDKLINTMLNWFEDNRPNQELQLNAYVKQCQQILIKDAVAPIFWEIFLVGGLVWQKLKRRVGKDITNNTEQLIKDLNAVVQDERVIGNVDLRKSIDDAINVLYVLQTRNASFSEEALTPEKNKEKIQGYLAFIDATVKPQLSNLRYAMNTLRKQEEKSTSGAIWYAFISSAANDVLKSMNNLEDAFTELKNDINEAMRQQKAPVAPTAPASVPAPAAPVVPDPKVAALTQLMQWKQNPPKKVSEAKKADFLKWVNDQIADINKATDPIEIQKLVDINKQVASQVEG